MISSRKISDNMEDYLIEPKHKSDDGDSIATKTLKSVLGELETSSSEDCSASKVILCNYYLDNADNEDDFLRGLALLKDLAEEGIPESQYRLGYEMLFSPDLFADEADIQSCAAKWLGKASDNGVIEARCFLGEMYAYGRGVEKDIKEAIRLLSSAAEHGMPYAQSALAHIYYYGNDVPVNRNEAYKWYSLAAEQSEGEAQFILGKMYYEGDTVKKDWNKALEYLKPALAKGYIDSRQMIDMIESCT